MNLFLSQDLSTGRWIRIREDRTFNSFYFYISGLVKTKQRTLIVFAPHQHSVTCPTLWQSWHPVTRLKSCLNHHSVQPLTSQSFPTAGHHHSAPTRTVGGAAHICCVLIHYITTWCTAQIVCAPFLPPDSLKLSGKELLAKKHERQPGAASSYIKMACL